MLSATQQRALILFSEHYGSLPGAVLGWAPGRLNLIGEHTDYNQGYVLPMAIDRGIAVVLRPRSDFVIQLYGANIDASAKFEIHNATGSDVPLWARYVGGVVATMHDDSKLVTGVDALIYGDLPMGGGLSSSAALETATAMAMQRAFGLSISALDMARLCQSVEHRYAGVQCGIMDQLASRMGREGSAVFVDCRNLHIEEVPIEFDDASLVVVDTTVPRTLDGSTYNERVEQCRNAAMVFDELWPGVTSLRDVTESMLEGAIDELDETAFRRCRHVIRENARVCAAVEDLSANNLVDFGERLYESHDSLRNDFAVSCPELDFVVECASDTIDVYGARMTGAGFGGNAIVLAKTAALANLSSKLVPAYDKQFGRSPNIHVVGKTVPAMSVTSAEFSS